MATEQPERFGANYRWLCDCGAWGLSADYERASGAATAHERACPNRQKEADFIDYPTGWAIQREVGDKLEHDPNCSSVPGSNGGLGGPGFLCDCAAMPVEWARRAIEQEPEREAEIRQTLQRYLLEASSDLTPFERLALIAADMEGVLREVANSGVEFEDERVGYVTVQIDRPTWTALEKWGNG